MYPLEFRLNVVNTFSTETFIDAKKKNKSFYNTNDEWKTLGKFDSRSFATNRVIFVTLITLEEFSVYRIVGGFRIFRYEIFAIGVSYVSIPRAAPYSSNTAILVVTTWLGFAGSAVTHTSLRCELTEIFLTSRPRDRVL